MLRNPVVSPSCPGQDKSNEDRLRETVFARDKSVVEPFPSNPIFCRTLIGRCDVRPSSWSESPPPRPEASNRRSWLRETSLSVHPGPVSAPMNVEVEPPRQEKLVAQAVDDVFS